MILQSLWDELPRLSASYLYVAHCTVLLLCAGFSVRVHFGFSNLLPTLFTTKLHLGLRRYHDPDYVLPMNAVIGERILQRAVQKNRSDLLDAFIGIGRWRISPWTLIVSP